MPKNRNIEKMTDNELVGLAANNPDFFVYLVQRYEEKILRYIRRISSVSQETAEDLGQEIFIKAYLNIHQFDGRLKFSSWLYRIAHNHVISFWRKTKWEKEVIYWDDEDMKMILDVEMDLPKRIDDLLLKKKIADIFDQLKPAHKEVLILRYLEGRDYQDIGDIIKRPVGSVGKLISRAKAELKTKIIDIKQL
jgi:RNA polymerase sigma-70 factor (ECF subfamily)